MRDERAVASKPDKRCLSQSDLAVDDPRVGFQFYLFVFAQDLSENRFALSVGCSGSRRRRRATASSAQEPIFEFIIPKCWSEKPGFTGIKGPRLKLMILEYAASLRAFQDQVRNLVAEIGA